MADVVYPHGARNEVTSIALLMVSSRETMDNTWDDWENNWVAGATLADAKQRDHVCLIYNLAVTARTQ